MNVGKNEPRRDGPAKLTGRALYLDDLDIPGCWHGVTVRSSVPHGKIKSITYDPAFAWDECIVVTAKDIPGKGTSSRSSSPTNLCSPTRSCAIARKPSC